MVVPEGGTFLIGNVDLAGKSISGGGKIKKLSTAECAFHIKGDGTVIAGLTFQGMQTSGQPNTDVKLGDGARNIRIHGCTFRSPIYSAIAGAIDSSLPGGGAYAQQAEGVIIANNMFQGYARPLYLYSVSNLTITGNVIRDSLFDGLRLRENDGFCLIDSNQFINIGVPSWPDDQTRDAIDTYWSGKDLTITNNMVDTTAYIGFDLKGVAPDGSYNSSRVIVANNQIYRTRYEGIKISSGSEDPLAPHAAFYNVSGNIIHECNQNNREGRGGVGNAGIALLKVKHANVVDNFVFSCYGRGIFVNNPKSLDASGGDAEHKNKCIRISGNMCINNGQAASVSNSAGIISLGTGYMIVSENICGNDPGYPNSNMQGVGINISSTGTGFPNYKNTIVRDNICRNNVNYQIIITGADGLAVFEGNIQEGTNAAYRPWHHQRTHYAGNGIPSASDGMFRSGDKIQNIAATRTKHISHWLCVEDGTPGKWRAFGCGWGTTAERPVLGANDAGYQYLDSTLNKTILWDGGIWLGV
ncbi:right-handed parallel beta-helix repeat-containing protein [Paenibacillus ginsengarvi]|uniref:Right-handed parallel beta-helix repeat-containing protein n=1 Tax=Paenibacillus ginsengarvi TaxID=400777 RepID=A0A3B0CM66_9BACL|nr:right-handed parallel beta-helix repeat-containing protein [Paenibacillus ginsengarvi]